MKSSVNTINNLFCLEIKQTRYDQPGVGGLTHSRMGGGGTAENEFIVLSHFSGISYC